MGSSPMEEVGTIKAGEKAEWDAKALFSAGNELFVVKTKRVY